MAEKSEVSTSKVKDISKCSSQSTLIGESLEDVLKEGKLIILIHEGTDVWECYSYDELTSTFNSQRKLWYWDKGAVKSQPVYKLPYTGVWIDRVAYLLIAEEGYNTLCVYKKLSQQPIGSEFGVSQTHGEKFDIYSAIQVNTKLLRHKNYMQILKAVIPVFADNIKVTVTKSIIRSKKNKPESEMGGMGPQTVGIGNEPVQQIQNMPTNPNIVDNEHLRTRIIQSELWMDIKDIGDILSYEKIKSYAPSVNLLRLKRLIALSQGIIAISEDISKFQNLTSLSLNRILDLDWSVFIPLKHLENLDLNYISVIPLVADKIPALRTIFIGLGFPTGIQNLSKTFKKAEGTVGSTYIKIDPNIVDNNHLEAYYNNMRQIQMTVKSIGNRLSYQKIKEFVPEGFDFLELRVLILGKDSGISSIDKDISKFVNLEDLDMSYNNEIADLDWSVFIPLKELGHITLGSKIKEIPLTADKIPGLEVISPFSRSADIKNLSKTFRRGPSGDFGRFDPNIVDNEHLQTRYDDMGQIELVIKDIGPRLSYLKIKSFLPPDFDVSIVKSLTLSRYSTVTSISPDIDTFKNLLTLDIRGANIADFDWSNLIPLKKLKYINLGHKIKEIPLIADKIPHLEAIYPFNSSIEIKNLSTKFKRGPSGDYERSIPAIVDNEHLEIIRSDIGGLRLVIKDIGPRLSYLKIKSFLPPDFDVLDVRYINIGRNSNIKSISSDIDEFKNLITLDMKDSYISDLDWSIFLPFRKLNYITLGRDMKEIPLIADKIKKLGVIEPFDRSVEINNNLSKKFKRDYGGKYQRYDE